MEYDSFPAASPVGGGSRGRLDLHALIKAAEAGWKFMLIKNISLHKLYIHNIYYLMATTCPASSELHQAIACLGRLSHAFRHRREQLARSVQLSESQWELLEQIATEHFIPSMFARSRASSPAAVSKTLRQLLARGLIRVTLSATDGRQRCYQLTARGRKVMSRLRTERERAIEQIWMGLEPADLQAFVRVGTEIAQRIEQYSAERDAGPPAGRRRHTGQNQV